MHPPPISLSPRCFKAPAQTQLHMLRPCGARAVGGAQAMEDQLSALGPSHSFTPEDLLLTYVTCDGGASAVLATSMLVSLSVRPLSQRRLGEPQQLGALVSILTTKPSSVVALSALHCLLNLCLLPDNIVRRRERGWQFLHGCARELPSRGTQRTRTHTHTHARTRLSRHPSSHASHDSHPNVAPPLSPLPQVPLRKAGLGTLQLYANSTLPDHKNVANRILRSLSGAGANRNAMYRAELRMRAQDLYEDAMHACTVISAVAGGAGARALATGAAPLGQSLGGVPRALQGGMSPYSSPTWRRNRWVGVQGRPWGGGVKGCKRRGGMCGGVVGWWL